MDVKSGRVRWTGLWMAVWIDVRTDVAVVGAVGRRVGQVKSSQSSQLFSRGEAHAPWLLLPGFSTMPVRLHPDTVASAMAS